MPRCIYIFDFDKTFTVLHTRGFTVFKDGEEKQTYINRFISTNIRNLPRLRVLFKRALSEGHGIAMASFAHTPSVKTVKSLDEYKNLEITEQNILGGKELILAYLDVAFGKDRLFLQADDIQAFWAQDKNMHIENIINRFCPNPADRITKDRIVLIDDEIKNIETAKAAGYRTIHVVPQDEKYLDLIEADLNSQLVAGYKETGVAAALPLVCDTPPRLGCN